MVSSINPYLDPYANSYNDVKAIGSENKEPVSQSTTYENHSEDQAIISAQAKLLNEHDRYNSGQSDELHLALETVKAEHQVEANAAVFEARNDMLDTALELGEA